MIFSDLELCSHSLPFRFEHRKGETKAKGGTKSNTRQSRPFSVKYRLPFLFLSPLTISSIGTSTVGLFFFFFFFFLSFFSFLLYLRLKFNWKGSAGIGSQDDGAVCVE